MTDSPTPAAHRTFVPADLDAGDLAQVEPLYRALAARPLATLADLEAWLLDESALLAQVGAAVARRYIAMTCDTKDEATRERYLAIERDVVPATKALGDALDRKLLEHPASGDLDSARYGVLLRRRRALSEIFRPANVDLQRQESELESRQQAVMGGLTVTYAGQTHTLPAMARYQEDQARDVREGAWRATLTARESVWPELRDIFDRLVALRATMAGNAGFDDYTGYRFRQLQRLDYGPDTCHRFHDAVAEVVVPAVARLDANRCQRLGIETLRPWDLAVDPEGAPPHRPFTTDAELVEIATRLFARIDRRFAGELTMLRDRGLLDLMSRDGKAPGGYQYTLEDVGLPFIFANAVGTHDDVQTLLHEGGHAFHALSVRAEPLIAYREAPIEMAETASMSMELLALEHLEETYAPADARRARSRHLESVLRLLPWIASIDAFQHWIYAHPRHSAAERSQTWLALRARFAPGIDYRGVEAALENQWMQQGHLFTHPHYYIEYGIAQLASLQVWQAYRREPESAIAAYRDALALGGSRPLPELLAAAGVAFDVSPKQLTLLVRDVEAELARCRGARA